MAKLSALTELAATPASGDEMYIRDISVAASAESKRITLANLLATALANYDLGAFLLVGNGGSTGIAISAAGEVTMAAQPSVFARNSTTDDNVTGNGTQATVDFDSEIYDQNADFASDTFTAPVAGRVLVCAEVMMDGRTTAHTYSRMQIVTSNQAFEIRIMPDTAVTNATTLTMSLIVDMDAADTITITVTSYGESSNVQDIVGDSAGQGARVSIHLLA
jgi:hypothetical protein